MAESNPPIRSIPTMVITDVIRDQRIGHAFPDFAELSLSWPKGRTRWLHSGCVCYVLPKVRKLWPGQARPRRVGMFSGRRLQRFQIFDEVSLVFVAEAKLEH